MVQGGGLIGQLGGQKYKMDTTAGGKWLSHTNWVQMSGIASENDVDIFVLYFMPCMKYVFHVFLFIFLCSTFLKCFNLID